MALQTKRKIIQFVFLVYILFVSLSHAMGWAFGENLHGICPFGAIETLGVYIKTGDFVKHISYGNFYILSGLILTLIFFGSYFCGWICPFGTVQEYLNKIGKKLFGGRYFNKVPQKIDKSLRYFKYLFLFFILFQTSRQFILVFENLDPYYTFFNIWSDEIALSAYIVLAITLLANLFIERAYCKYMCPLGAFNGLFNKINIFKLKRNKTTCISCKKCDKACPLSIDISTKETISDVSCIKCGLCTDVCPVNTDEKKTLRFKFKEKVSKNYWFFALVLFISPIIVGVVNGSFKEVEEKSFETVGEIRGSYTLKEITDNFPITREEFIYAFGLDDSFTDESKIKDVEPTSGISTEVIRTVIENLDKPISESLENIPKSIVGSTKLREAIKTKDKGFVAKLYLEKDESYTVTLKKSSLLKEVEGSVKDFKDFKKQFNLPTDIKLNTSLRELETEYGISTEEIKVYVENNKK